MILWWFFPTRARWIAVNYANALKKPLTLLYKERDYSHVAKNASETNLAEIKFLGNVRDKTVFIADNIPDINGTLLKAMRVLKENSAGKVI
jgi:ribose-phosphate pyrophosphokinase